MRNRKLEAEVYRKKLTREPSLASPRLIPEPVSLPPSTLPPPASSVDDKDPLSASFGRKCAPFQAPVADTINYDQLSSGPSHELRKQRDYHKKDTRAVLRTRLAATDALDTENAERRPQDMDTSTSVLGKRTIQMEETVDTGTTGGGNTEKRPRSEALEIALAVDLEVAEEHALWWNLELNPPIETHHSSVMEGVDGAVPRWVVDECNRVLGRELSPQDGEQHAELLQAVRSKELVARRKFDVFEPRKDCNVSKQIA